MRLSVALVLVSLTVTASAANLPELDIKVVCARQTEDSLSTLTAEECIENETLARDELRRLVGALSEESIQKCAKSVSESGPSSYLAILGCIGQSRKAVAAPGDHPQPRSEIASQVTGLAAGISPPIATVEAPKEAPEPNAIHFGRNLGLHSNDPDVKLLQIFLNAHGFPIAGDGPGSPGHEVETFGPSTKAALEKFQEAHAKELGITGVATGRFGAAIRKYINGL